MGPLGEDLGVSLLNQKKVVEFANDSYTILERKSVLIPCILNGAIKQQEPHTMGIEISCPEVVEVAIASYRDKGRADSFNLLTIPRAGYKTDIICPDDEIFCNC